MSISDVLFGMLWMAAAGVIIGITSAGVGFLLSCRKSKLRPSYPNQYESEIGAPYVDEPDARALRVFRFNWDMARMTHRMTHSKRVNWQKEGF